MNSVVQKACLLGFLALSVTSAPTSGADTKRDQAWAILQTNITEKSADKRALAIGVLGLLPGDSRAIKLVDEATDDEKSDVRAAAATALGQLHGKSYIALLHKLLDDNEPSVVLAAASALVASKDPEGYDAYYEFLTGGRKTNRGLIATQMKTLRDPKKMAELGIEQGLGFVPYAGIGVEAFKTLHADDVSPVRAAAAKMLASDPDPESGRALVKATSDKSWLVRAAALESIAKRGDPRLIDGIAPAMLDDNISVRCTAAAAVIRLSTIANRTMRAPKSAEPTSN